MRCLLVLVALAGCGRPQPRPPVDGPALDVVEPALPAASTAAHDVGRLTARPVAPQQGGRREGGVVPLGLGGARDGLLFIPSSYDPARPAAFVLLLHGAGGSAQRILTRVRDTAEREGIILLAPDSRGRTWDVSRPGFGDDVPFIDRALAWTFARFHIDPARVSIAGFSDGASFALSLGLTNGELFHGIVAFSPGYLDPRELEGRPRIFVSHGTEDEILPIDASSRRMVPALQQHGYDVRYLEFTGGHRVTDEVLAAAFDWLRR